jgi:AcrR family transcriptional regulator
MFGSERVRFSESIPSPPLSLRERKKSERRRRIEEAAYATFREKGYAAATTREIAARADIGVATLFAYARDKQALLMMIFNERLETVTATAFASVDPQATLEDQLVHVFQPRYEIFGQDPHLSQRAIFYFSSYSPDTDDSHEMMRFMAHRQNLRSQVETLVRSAQSAGSLDAGVEAPLATALILDIFFNEVREWLVGRPPSVVDGIVHLRRVLELALRGSR